MNKKDYILIVKCLMICFLGLLFSYCKKEAKDENQREETLEISAQDPLPSWNDGNTKRAIIDYVSAVSTKGSDSYVQKEDRIATFDNDGTLWSEQPVYFEFFFAMDRIRMMAPDHPEWKNRQPYKAVLDRNMKELLAQGEPGLSELVMATHSGMTAEGFEKSVEDWMNSARHPTKNKPYNHLVFQPMLELIAYLKANDFTVFIVSGGGIEFMRPWAEKVYGIPKNQIIGSSLKERFVFSDDSTIIQKLPELDFYNDKEGKPVAINKFIGRKPLIAIGNSDGDLQMLQYAASNSLKCLSVYIHHTDSIREWSYDRKSPIGTFDKGWDEAVRRGWLIVDMKRDWNRVYPDERVSTTR